MTNAKKTRLADLIEAYGTYQYLLGKLYQNRDEKQDEIIERLERLKAVCKAMKSEFGIETWDLSIASAN